MKRYVYTFLVLLLLFSSCSRKESRPQDPLMLQPSDFSISKTPMTLSGLLGGKCNVVRLETNDSCLIGGRTIKVLKRFSSFYVRSYSEVLRFDGSGRFTGKLSRAGSGPEEYVDLYDFDVLEVKGEKEIWVSTTGGIKVYDAATFGFKRNIDVDEFVNQFQYVNDNTIILVTPGEKTFKVCDLNGTVRHEFWDKDLANSTSMLVQFSIWHGEVFYQLDMTQDAVVYDPQSDAFKLQYMFPPQKGMLTVEANREYYDSYGYMQQVQEVMKDFTCVGAVRCHGENSMITTRDAGRNYITVCRDGTSQTYEYAPETSLESDLIPTEDLSFLATLTACDSDEGFLFFISAEQASEEAGIGVEDNPILVDVNI